MFFEGFENVTEKIINYSTFKNDMKQPVIFAEKLTDSGMCMNISN